MKERTLVTALRVTLRRELGGWWVKLHGGMFQAVGLPDIIGCCRGRFIAIECKVPGKLDTVTERQHFVLEAIRDAGGLAFVTDNKEYALARIKKWLG